MPVLVGICSASKKPIFFVIYFRGVTLADGMAQSPPLWGGCPSGSEDGRGQPLPPHLWRAAFARGEGVAILQFLWYTIPNESEEFI